MLVRDEGFAIRNGQILNVQCRFFNYQPEEHIVEGFHYHKYHELIYLISGNIEAYIYDKQYHCKQGDTILIFSNEPHTFFRPLGCECIVIKFIPEILSAYEQTPLEFEYLYNISNIISERPRAISDIPELKDIAFEIIKYFDENKYGNELFIRADIIKAYAHIIRYWYDNNNIVSLSDKTTSENLKIISKAAEYATENLGNVKTHQAAKMCGFSDGHFSRLFKEMLGVTFSEYAKTIRINEAIKLLQCTNDTITDIALKLGYSSSSHFIYDFKKAKGVSPKKYFTDTSSITKNNSTVN